MGSWYNGILCSIHCSEISSFFVAVILNVKLFKEFYVRALLHVYYKREVIVNWHIFIQVI